MFPVTKQAQLITKPLFQTLTATGGIDPATIHIGELTSALSTPNTKRRGCSCVSPQSHGHSFNSPARQECVGCTAMTLFALLTYYLPSLFFPFFFRALKWNLQNSYSASRVPFYPWIRCSVNTSGSYSAKLSVSVWQWGKTEPRASGMLDKSPAAESHPSPMYVSSGFQAGQATWPTHLTHCGPAPFKYISEGKCSVVQILLVCRKQIY